MSHCSDYLGGVVVGVDLGDKWSHFCMLGSDGEVVDRGRVRTTPTHFAKRFADCETRLFAIEVGTHSRWVSQTLGELGHEVLVANPRKLRLIYQSDQKNDALDAERLARLARVDPSLLSPIRHRGQQAQADLTVIRCRDALVRARTLLINSVRGSAKAAGGRIQPCASKTFHKKALEGTPESIRSAVAPLIQQIESLTKEIARQDKRIASLAENDYPETKRLRQITGVGALTSLAFMLTIEDPARFPRSRSVGRFLGLTPRQFDSGATSQHLRITKAGDSYLRRLLVGSAHYVLGPFGPDTDLRRWGLALANRGGKAGKKRAVVAVARKLAVLLLRLWRTGEVYVPLRDQSTHSSSSSEVEGSPHPVAAAAGPRRGKPAAGATDGDSDGVRARKQAKC